MFKFKTNCSHNYDHVCCLLAEGDSQNVASPARGHNWNGNQSDTQVVPKQKANTGVAGGGGVGEGGGEQGAHNTPREQTPTTYARTKCSALQFGKGPLKCCPPKRSDGGNDIS